MDTKRPQSGAWTQNVHNQEHGHSTAQSRMEKDKDKHLHDMVQKYSNGEIAREQYTRILWFTYQVTTEL